MHLDKINELISIDHLEKIPSNCLNFINVGKNFFQKDLLNTNRRFFFIVPDSRFFSVLFSIGYLVANYSNHLNKKDNLELKINHINNENFHEIRGKYFAILENDKIKNIGYAEKFKVEMGLPFIVLKNKDGSIFVNQELLKNKKQKIFYYEGDKVEKIIVSKSFNKHNRNLLSICLNDKNILESDFLKNEKNSNIMFLGNLNKFNIFLQMRHQLKNKEDIYKFADIVKLKNNNNNFYNSYFKTNRNEELELEPNVIIYTDASSFINNEYIEEYNFKPKIIFLSPNNRYYFEAVDKINNLIIENKIFKSFDLNSFRFQYPFTAFVEQ